MSTEPSAPAGETASILLVGAGKMGGALLEGWMSVGTPGRSVTVLDPAPGAELRASCAARGFALNPAAAAIATPDVLVLAVKPQALDAVAPSIAGLIGPHTLVVSIIAGKTMGDLAARLPRARVIIRAMPNTPAAVGRGITGAAASTTLTEPQRLTVDRLLEAVGRVEWLDGEHQIDAVTAVSGSGPAYVFYLAECLAKAGEAAGLDPARAARLARATVEGAGELMYRSPEIEPGVLRQNVTSPGGTTAAALAVLSGAEGLEGLMERAVGAARKRAGELAG